MGDEEADTFQHLQLLPRETRNDDEAPKPDLVGAILEITDHIGDGWRTLARHLGLTVEEVSQLEEKTLPPLQRDVRYVTYDALKMWQKRRGEGATVCELMQALAAVDNRRCEELVRIVLNKTVINACLSRNERHLPALSAAGLDLNYPDPRHGTPLHIAVSNHNILLGRYLLQSGVDPTVQNLDGFTALQLACKNRNADFVRIMIPHLTPAQINLAHKDYGTALIIACSGMYGGGNEELIRQLLAAGAATDLALEDTGFTALHLAVDSNSLEGIQFLIDAGVNLEAKSRDGATPLDVALECLNASVVLTLLLGGATGHMKPKNRLRWTPLHFACYYGNCDITTRLLENGCEADIKDKLGRSPLHLACYGFTESADDNEMESNGRHTDVIDALANHRATFNVVDEIGRLPLHLACKFGGPDIVRKLIQRCKADVNATDITTSTPAHYACEGGQYAVLELLVAEGVDTAAVDMDNSSLLHVTCQHGGSSGATTSSAVPNKRTTERRVVERTVSAPSLRSRAGSVKASGADAPHPGLGQERNQYWGHHREITEYLLGLGASLDATDWQGASPLHIACRFGAHDIVKILLDANASLSARDTFGFLPLHYTSSGGHTGIVRTLLANGADLEAEGGNGARPLHGACLKGGVDTLKVFLEHGADINANVKKFGVTPMVFASIGGRSDVIKYLIELDFSVNERICHQATPLMAASTYSQAASVRTLLENGADVNAVGSARWSALHCACRAGSSEIVKILLSYSVNVDIQDFEGATAFHMACSFGYHEIAKTLMTHGVDVRVRGKMGYSALHYACEGGNQDVVKTLLVNGLDPNCRDENGAMPLHIAAKGATVEVVTSLLSSGAELKVKDKHGRTPLHCACQGNQSEIASLLIGRGIDVDSVDIEGATAVHYASQYGDSDLMDVLLGHAPSVDVKDAKGTTPLAIAKKRKQKQLQYQLLRSGAQGDFGNGECSVM